MEEKINVKLSVDCVYDDIDVLVDVYEKIKKINERSFPNFIHKVDVVYPKKGNRLRPKEVCGMLGEEFQDKKEPFFGISSQKFDLKIRKTLPYEEENGLMDADTRAYFESYKKLLWSRYLDFFCFSEKIGNLR